MANLIPIKNIKPSKKINSDSFFGKKIVENLPTLIDKVEENKSTKTKTNLLKTEFILIRKKVIKIDKLLNAFIKFEKKNQEGTRKEKESGKRSEKEAKLEKKKDKIGAISFPSIPVGGNFLESIKRFLFFTFLNIALPKLLELLPKLIQFGKSILPVTSFLLDIVGGAGKGLLSGLVNFIDWGYKIRDSTEKTIKEIGGEKSAKEFNEFNKKLNTFIDLSILAGLTALDVGLDAEKFRKKKLEEGKVKPKKPGKVGVTEGRGGERNLGRKAEVTAGKGGARNLGKGAKVTVSGEQTGILKNLKGPFAKLKGPLSKFAGAAVPGLGAVVGAADAKARFSSGDNIGGTLASVSASLDALAAGSAILAATGIGAAVPAAFATVSMGIDAVLLIRDILKIFNIPIFKNGGQIELFAEGGRIGTSGRTIKPQRKSFGPKVSKQEITPGKDIGGKQQILKLFPDPSPENINQTKVASPWWAKWLGLGQDQNQNAPLSGKPANPYKALKNTAEILNKIPGDLGRLMSAGAMIPLGQKPDRNIGKGFGSFVGKVTQDAIDNNINLSFSDIIRSMSGFANGGDITNQNIVKNSDIGYKVGQVVGKVIESMITSKVNEAVSSIQKEISSIGKPPEETSTTPGGGGDAGNIVVSSDQSDFWLLATASLFEGISPQGYADVAQAIYNRVAMPGDPWHVNGSIRKTILNPGQFQPVTDYGGSAVWGKINNKESAIAFVKSKGRTQAQLESAAASLLDTTRQRSAKTFVGPRDSFRSYSYEDKHDDLARDTEARRDGHVFGFEHKGATIAAFRQNKLKPAEINKVIVSGTVHKPSTTPTKGAIGAILPQGNPQFSSGFKWRSGRQHRGHDYGVDANSPVLSSTDGKVVDIYRNFGGHGDAIVVKHSDGSKVVYGHVNVGGAIANGSTVKKGQQIATVKHWIDKNKDNTHLHLERIENGKHVDPTSYVNSLQPQQKPSAPQKPAPPQKPSAPRKPPHIRQGVVNYGGQIYYRDLLSGKYFEIPKNGANPEEIDKRIYDMVLSYQKISLAPQQESKVAMNKTGATQALIAPRQPKTDLAMNVSPTPNVTPASFAPQKPKEVNVAYNPSYQEGQSGFIAIQPIKQIIINQTA